MATLEIIRPQLEHVGLLSELGKVTFAETFTGLSYYTPAIVEGYTTKAFAPEVIRRDLADDRIRYFLIKLDGALAGYAKLVERTPAACIAHLHAIQLERIYLLRAFQGRGLGSRLLAEVYREASARGYAKLWLGVWELNRPAVDFYRRHGFRHAGEWDWVFESCGVRYVDRDWIFLTEVPDL